ncbi:hypothetical protein SCLCIDRAFT_1135215 [Scleroderma citrinum Foug A]|uniref:Uncharacterized protein n=1 Tax=Scleroderma citrinum Foug A TaxID=1036808 RepID=A0A0C2ZY79_9AGAM|nr:hypothetical protein SCLCIDRAFT_1135215 [Scleroderma citrinum Foug A]
MHLSQSLRDSLCLHRRSRRRGGCSHFLYSQRYRRLKTPLFDFGYLCSPSGGQDIDIWTIQPSA